MMVSLKKIGEKIASRFGYVPAEEIRKIVSTFYSSQTMGVQTSFTWKNMVDSYKSWVYTCVDRIAKDVAMLPLRLFVYRRAGKKINDPSFISYYRTIEKKHEREYYLKQIDVERQEVSEHIFLDLQRRPNLMMYRFTFWYNVMIRLELGGLCGLYLVRDKLMKVPREVWPLPLTKFASLKAVPDAKTVLKGWRYEEGDVMTDFSSEEIVPLMYPNPASIYEPMGALMAQEYPYNIELFLMQQQKSLFENQAITDNLTTDQKLTKEQVTALIELINEKYAGSMKAGKTMVLHSGLKSDPRGQTGREAMIDKVANWASEKLISSFDMSKGTLGVVADVNRANMEGLERTYVRNALRPRCMILAEGIEAFWLPMYDRGLFLDFELPDIEDQTLTLAERKQNIDSLYSSVNEERAKEGKEPVPWGDVPWIPFTMTQYGSSPPPPSPAKGKIVDDADEDKKLDDAFWTENRKTVHWSRIMRHTEHLQMMVLTPLRMYFSNQKEQVIDRLHKNAHRIEGRVAGWSRTKVENHLANNGRKDINDININVDDEGVHLRTIFRPLISTIMVEGGNARMAELNAHMVFNLNDPKVQQYLGDRLERFSAQVSGTTFDTIEAILREGFAEGKPVSAIAEELRLKFDSWDAYRAPLIAQHETLSAYNQADVLSIGQSGLEGELNKFWLSARDSKCRPEHAIADEHYRAGIPANDDFVVGGDRMIAPCLGRDPKMNIGCRCVLGWKEKK